MMLPRRVPFIGAVPLPMISSWARSLTSPTSTQTFDVPMSRATMYLSSVFGMELSSILECGGRAAADVRERRHGRRTPRFHDDSIGEAQVDGFDAAELLVRNDGVEVAPLRGELVAVGVDERAELAVEDGEAARRDGADLRDARVELRGAAAGAQERDAARRLAAAGVADDRQIVVADGRRELGEGDAVVIDVVDRPVAQHERDRRPLGDLDAQGVGNLGLDVDAAHPGQRADVAAHAGDVELEEIHAAVLLRDGVERGARRVRGAVDLDGLHRELRARLRVPIRGQRAENDGGDDEDVARDGEEAPDLDLPVIAADAAGIGRTEEALGRLDAARHHTTSPTPRTSASATS